MMRRFAGIIGMAVLFATSALADGDTLQSDFTFHRITVPPSGAGGNRITVQIAPVAPGGPTAPSSPSVAGTTIPSASASGTPGVAGASPQVSSLDWFWDAIPPELDATQPGRVILALDALNEAPEGEAVVEPRLSALHEIAAAHGRDIMISTIDTRVSPALALAIIAVESAGASNARSRAGALGLMQLMPDTAARFDVADPFNASQNIRGGVAYLDWLMEEFDYDPILYLSAYNAGEGNIWDNSGVPDFAETRAYVPKVIAAWKVARALCVTPPELMTDGCVFSTNGD